jgi:hypothetical protein
MKIRKNVINKIHPEAFKISSRLNVIEFDNKFDVLEFLKNNPAIDRSIEHTRIFNDNLQNYTPDNDQVEKIKNEVLNNLVKRGIITGTVYEGFKYHVDGEIIDHAALAAGDPNCMKTPIKKYDKHFYELYINMSVPGSVSGEVMTEGAIRLIETIKALEERDIEIKVNVTDYSKELYYDEDLDDLLVIIPLMSHLDHKDYRNLMPYIHDSFLRGPLFTIARNSIDNKSHVKSSMGTAYRLNNAVNLWNLDEVQLAEKILGDLDLLKVV